MKQGKNQSSKILWIVLAILLLAPMLVGAQTPKPELNIYNRSLGTTKETTQPKSLYQKVTLAPIASSKDMEMSEPQDLYTEWYWNSSTDSVVLTGKKVTIEEAKDEVVVFTKKEGTTVNIRSLRWSEESQTFKGVERDCFVYYSKAVSEASSPFYDNKGKYTDMQKEGTHLIKTITHADTWKDINFIVVKPSPNNNDLMVTMNGERAQRQGHFTQRFLY